MIDQPHRLHLGEARAVASADEADAQAVAGRSGGFFQNDVEAAVVLAGQSRCGALGSTGAQGFQQGPQGGRQGHGVKFARIGVLPLGVGHVENVALEVDLGEGHGGFGEAAAQVEHDFKDISHPCGAARKLVAGFLQEVGSEVGLGLDRSKADFGQRNDVALGVVAAHGLVKQEGKEFGLHARGILPDSLRLAPLHELIGVFVANLARVGQALYGEKAAKVGPRNLGAAAGARAGIVGGDVVRNPSGEMAGVVIFENAAFVFGGGSRGQAPRGLGLGGIGVAQLCGGVAPRAGLGVAAAEDPEGRLFDFAQGGHFSTLCQAQAESRRGDKKTSGGGCGLGAAYATPAHPGRVPHSLTFRSEVEKVPHGITWINRVRCVLEKFYHYTTGQYKLLKNQGLMRWCPMGSLGTEDFLNQRIPWSLGDCGGLSKGKGALV